LRPGNPHATARHLFSGPRQYEQPAKFGQSASKGVQFSRCMIYATTGPAFQDSPMTFAASVIDAIGHTPLIELRAASKATGCRILGKAEFMNPGGSVKDRAALYIVKDAIDRGVLKHGGVIVEGTAGNTGIGLALVANAMGFRTVIVIPDTQSQEKKDMLRFQGAQLVEVPAVPYANPNNYVKLSGRLAERLAKTEAAGAIWANQFDNLANRSAHIATTGPEIFDTLNGAVDGFICACGTGGTLAGVGMALKARNPDIRIGLADPFGAALYAYYTTGELKAEGSSITEGIGQGRITANLEDAPIDIAYRIPDSDALDIVFALAEEEGLLLGGSSGINVAGAIRLARDLGPGHTIVTILCDGGARYASKLYNPEFLHSLDLPTPAWLAPRAPIDPGFV
jgi:cysteine synthase A